MNAIADLERYTVSVVVAGSAVTNSDIADTIHVDCPAATTVNILVFSAVAINDEIFEHDVCSIDGTQDREGIADPRMVLLLVVVAQCHGIDDHVWRLHTGNTGNRYRPPCIRNIIDNPDAHPWTKLSGIGNGEEGLSVITVFDQRAFNPST